MVEVKEPFIAEHAAPQRVPARRPRRTAGGAPSSLPSFALLKGEPCRAKLCPIPPTAGSAPVSSRLGRGVGGWVRGATHGARQRPDGGGAAAAASFRLWPGTARFGDGTRGARELILRGNPASNTRGARLSRTGSALPGDGGRREACWLFGGEVAICSDGRLRCGAVPAGFCKGALAAGLRGDATHGKAVPIPPARFDAEGRGPAWEGARLPNSRATGRPVARLPRCWQGPCGSRDRRYS